MADPTWEPYRATPPYSDYPSGHAVVTGTFAEAARMFLGNDVALNLVSVPATPPLPDRSFSTLSAIEDEAFMARIYAGIHFRDAMNDGVLPGSRDRPPRGEGARLPLNWRRPC